MKRVDLKHKYFAFIAVVTSFMVFAMPILAQVDEFTAGRMAGEQAARAAVNGSMWLAIGCLGWLPGLVVAYVYQPVPPATQLLGKSPEFVASYTDAYKATAKRTQVSKAWMGCIASTIITSVALGVVYGSEWFDDSGDDNGYYDIDTW